MNAKLRRMSHKVGLNFWHMEWCTKYRYKMMRKLANKNLVEATIRKAACEHKIKVHELSVLPEHVHMLVTLPNAMTDSKALKFLKGRSAYLILRNGHTPTFRLGIGLAYRLLTNSLLSPSHAISFFSRTQQFRTLLRSAAQSSRAATHA